MGSRNTLFALLVLLFAGGLVGWMLLSGPTSSSPVALAAAPGDVAGAESATLAGSAGPEEGETETDAGEGRTLVHAAEVAALVDDGHFEPDAVYGRILDPDGEAVPAAPVFLVPRQLRPEGGDRVLAATESDEEGRFRFSGLDPLTNHHVLVCAEGFVPRSEQGGCGIDREITLARARAIEGRVLDAETGDALPEVEVILSGIHVDGEEVVDEYVATSELDGTYRLPWARLEGQQRLQARRPHHQRQGVELQVHPDRPDGYDLHLRVGHRLFLELYELETGDPLPDLAVVFDDAHEERTDAAGRIECSLTSHERRQSKSGWMSVTAQGWCTTRYSAKLEDVAPDSTVRLPLSRGARIHGRVRDVTDERPLTEAWVWFDDEPEGNRRSRNPAPFGELPPGVGIDSARTWVRTDEEGHYELTGLVPRPTAGRVAARHETHGNDFVDVDPLETGDDREVDLALARGAVIRGTARLGGEPTSVTITLEGEEDWEETVSNDRGRYTFLGVPAGEVTLRTQRFSESWGSRDGEVEDVLWIEAGQTLEHDIEIDATIQTITGLVRDRSGEAIRGASVTVHQQERNRYRSSYQDTTDGDGAFQIELPPGNHGLFTLYAQDGPRRVTLQDVAAGTHGLEIVLPEMGTLALRVLDQKTREAIRGFSLFWRAAGEGEYVALTQGSRTFSPGPDGVFLAELPLGAVDVIAGATGQGYSARELVGLRVGAESSPPPSEVALARGATLELVFLPAEGEETRPPNSLRRGRIHLSTDEEQKLGSGYYNRTIQWGRAVRPDREGRVVLEAIGPGRYRFRNVPDDLELIPAEIDVPATDRATYEIRWKTVTP